jgi:NTE family protein
MINGQKLGIVLGAGVGRGWAHIGVLQGLTELGVKPDIVCGCSIGALIGASYVNGNLDELTNLATSLTWSSMLSYMDVSFGGGGLIEGRRIVEFFENNIENTSIEHTTPTYGAVATELHTGRETWLTSGSIIDAVRASIAVPGLLTPVQVRGKWLVDGGLVNPLPVSLCRSLGADIIIGVSMSGDLVSRLQTPLTGEEVEADQTTNRSEWMSWLSQMLPFEMAPESEEEIKSGVDSQRVRPGYVEVIGESFFIVQNFVSRVRLAADPVDFLIAPDVAHIGVMEFHRAKEAIEAGRMAVRNTQDIILRTIQATQPQASDPIVQPR